MMRFGSIKLSETSFPLLASALTFQYLCIRYSRTRESKSKLYFRSFAVSFNAIWRVRKAGTVVSPLTSISRKHGSKTHTVTGTETATGAEALATTDVAGETSRNAAGGA